MKHFPQIQNLKHLGPYTQRVSDKILDSDSESDSESEETTRVHQNNSTNVVKIQNMEDDSIEYFKTIVDIRNCWKIQYMNLCHCGRYHHLTSHRRHEIIELTNEKDKNKENNTSMRSVIRFFINEFIDELEYQKELKEKTIRELDRDENKEIMNKLEEEICGLGMKIEIYKQVFFNDYSG